MKTFFEPIKVTKKRMRAITGGMVIALRENIVPYNRRLCGMNKLARKPKRIELETRKPKAVPNPLSADNAL